MRAKWEEKREPARDAIPAVVWGLGVEIVLRLMELISERVLSCS